MTARDRRHTSALVAHRAGADLRFAVEDHGHASITVTSHIYADLYDDEPDDVASALDSLDDGRRDGAQKVWPHSGLLAHSLDSGVDAQARILSGCRLWRQRDRRLGRVGQKRQPRGDRRTAMLLL